MKKIVTMALISVMAVSLVGCKKDIIGTGPYRTENRTVAGFTAIDLRMNGNVYYKKGNVPALEIVAQQNVLDQLETSVINNSLVIQYRDGKTYDADHGIRINVTAPQVNSFTLNTSGSIFCLDDMETTSLFLHSNGSGNISLKNIRAGSIEAISRVSGSIIAMDGHALNENLKTSGSGQINLSGISAKTATVRTSGSGKIQLRVTNYLHATIEGSGSIYYGGYPDVSSHISGSGHLIHF